MTIHQTRTAPARRVPPAARQPGPVTLAIRALRPNEEPSWEARQAQIDAEERAALRALRKRIKAQIDADLARVDRCLIALDLMDGDADLEESADSEPSLCGSDSMHFGGQLTPSTNEGDDREDDAGDNAEEENEHGSDCDLGEDSLGSLHGTAAGVDLGQRIWSAGCPGDFECDIQSEPHDAEEDDDRDSGCADPEGALEQYAGHTGYSAVFA